MNLPYRSIRNYVNAVLVTIIFLTFGASDAVALELKLGVNQTFFQTDTGETFVTYTLEVKNNNVCNQPVDAVIVFDKSGSMDDNGGNPPEPITGAKAAVNSFLDKLQPTQDQAALVQFDKEVKLRTKLSKNYGPIRSAIASLTANESTNISDAVKVARQEVLSSRKNPAAKQVIILFSDGTAHAPTGNDATDRQLALDEAKITRNSGVLMATIGLGTGPELDTNTLSAMASPGMFYYAPTTAEMAEAYANIAKGLDGTATGVVAWVDVTELAQVATFVSASNSGRFENNKVVWNIGDLACNATVPLTFTFKFKGPVIDKFTDESIGKATDSQNNEFLSNPVTIEAVGPWLSVTKTDNKTEVKNYDQIEYVITVKNVGLGDATNMTVKDTLPNYVNYISSDIPGVTKSGATLQWVIPRLNAGQSISYKITAKLILPELVTNGRLLNTVQVTNDNQVVTAEDVTNIVYTPPPPGNNNPPSNNNNNDNPNNDDSIGNVIIIELPNTGEKVEEKVDFHEDTLQYISECTTKTIQSAEHEITSNGSIAIVEYSLDNGSNWFPFTNLDGLGTSSVKFTLQSVPLPDKLYGVKIRAQSVLGGKYESNLYEFPHNCSGQIVILGNYYKNGFGSGVLTDKGDFIYNNTLLSQLDVETLGAFGNLRLRLASSREDMEQSTILLDMKYNYEDELWYVNLDKSLLQRDVTYARVETYNTKTGEVILYKDIPSIINLDFIEEFKAHEELKDKGGYSYEVYQFEGETWQKLNYEKEMNEPEYISAFQKFNLYPGSYYIKVRYPNGNTYYTKKFSLDDPTVVRVETTDPDGSLLDTLFDQYRRNLDIKTFSKNNPPLITESLQEVPSKETVDLYRSLLADITFGQTQPDAKVLAIYWDRWNPHFSEQLSMYEEINKRLEHDGILEPNSDTFRKIVLITDPKNYDELKRILAIRKSDLEAIKVSDTNFLQKELRYQPEIVMYDVVKNRISRIRSNPNYTEMENNLINLEFILP